MGLAVDTTDTERDPAGALTLLDQLAERLELSRR